MPASILSAEEVKQLIADTANISVKLDIMTSALKDMRDDQKAEQTLARQNMDRLSRIESSHEEHHRRISDNFEQHKNDFFPRITELEKKMGVVESVMVGQEKEDSRTDKKIEDLKTDIESKLKPISDKVMFWSGSLKMILISLSILGVCSGIVFGVLRLLK